ncbi:hypothetical protein V6N12_051959 [Hibiscus sabdariffa]|uniref:Sugar phosphate transporter domain-containing protein n=1 Tax=Hibiscus sabdariffa TaxID=183260 RepID=A0ABR2GHN7_9ROSI
MASVKKEGLPLIDPSKIERGRETAVASAVYNRGAYAALGYMFSAVLLVLFNKAALSSYSFPYANVITLFQMICSSVLLYAMKRWKIISFTEGEPERTARNPVTLVPLRSLFHTLPLAVSYLLYMLITMESVRGINVPMYTTLRRTTVAFTMTVEYLLTGRKHSSYVIGSVGIIIFGAFVAGARDLSFDAYSYTIVFIANICTALYLASIAHIGKSSGLNSFGLMWCNVCDSSLLYHGFPDKLFCILEYNTQFSSDTDDMWKFEENIGNHCPETGRHYYNVSTIHAVIVYSPLLWYEQHGHGVPTDLGQFRCPLREGTRKSLPCVVWTEESLRVLQPYIVATEIGKREMGRRNWSS